MGKCLSCCPSNNQSATSQTTEDKFTDIAHRSTTEVAEQQPGGMSSSHCDWGTGEPNANNKTSLSITDKLKIPILSSMDNKRSSHSREYSEGKVNAFFEQYKDRDENAVLAEGIERFCNDLGMPPDDFRILLLAWKFNAKHMFCFTKEEFFHGCKALKADSIQDIQSRFPDMVVEVRCAERFKDFYRFTFKFGLEPDQRVLMSEMAIQLWKLVFYGNEPPILHRWLFFLEKHPSVRGISRDTWNMFLNFCESVGNDLSSYDDTAAWPSLFDDFVEYENDQTNQNIVPSKEKGILDT
ncbi:hypothetical protein JTE90_012864 [Oedothorax gibbosus]|uniref:Defective in cullin neddylation protein n=1 Tax=Oedothorax gibbosus TaxID=931172 RepID=A0AAV6UM84_9ARAC|nr:hypothetical protein JTE90_012864 [Oedothorax gibbosus]